MVKITGFGQEQLFKKKLGAGGGGGGEVGERLENLLHTQLHCSFTIWAPALERIKEQERRGQNQFLDDMVTYIRRIKKDGENKVSQCI